MKEFTNAQVRVLVSGWWLAARPWHVMSWAQRELIARLEAEADPLSLRMAWPQTAPAPDADGRQGAAAWGGTSRWGRLVFEQLGLPRAASRLRPGIILVAYASAPVAAGSPTAAVFECGRAEKARGLDRLRTAAAQAGVAGAWRRLAWADEPHSDAEAQKRVLLAPAVSPVFRPQPADDDAARRRDTGLPRSYVLALGASIEDVRLLLAAWTWMTSSLGDAVKLVVGPLGSEAAVAAGLAGELGLAGSVLVFESWPWESLPAILRGASCLLAGDRLRSWQVLRWSLACGLPVAGVSSEPASAILGGAGFLVDSGEARHLGAAGLSLLVDQNDLARRLKQAGLARAADYHQAWEDGSLAAALSDPP